MNDVLLVETAGDAVTDDAPSAARLESDAAVLADSPGPDLRTPIQRGGLPVPVHVNNPKVQWMIKTNSFQVTYQSEDGSIKRSVAGLKVQFKDKDGRLLTPEEYRNAFKDALRNAKAAWNRLDRSPTDRFVIESEP